MSATIYLSRRSGTGSGSKSVEKPHKGHFMSVVNDRCTTCWLASFISSVNMTLPFLPEKVLHLI